MITKWSALAVLLALMVGGIIVLLSAVLVAYAPLNVVWSALAIGWMIALASSLTLLMTDREPPAPHVGAGEPRS